MVDKNRASQMLGGIMKKISPWLTFVLILVYRYSIVLGKEGVLHQAYLLEVDP